MQKTTELHTHVISVLVECNMICTIHSCVLAFFAKYEAISYLNL